MTEFTEAQAFSIVFILCFPIFVIVTLVEEHQWKAGRALGNMLEQSHVFAEVASCSFVAQAACAGSQIDFMTSQVVTFEVLI